MEKKRISKMMAYLLRHDPSGMHIDDRGFISLNELLGKLQNRWPELTVSDVRRIVEEDPKGRYEMSGSQIRALYGHSIDVAPDLPEADVGLLFHGTSSKSAARILEEGLKSQARRKVHLSSSRRDALKVGKRHTPDPVVLKVDACSARASGVKFLRASDRVYVTDYVPAKFIERN